MADIIADEVFDDGLQTLIDNCENLYICSSQPTTFIEASVTYKLGTKAAPTITGPADRAAGGREVTIPAFSDGVVDADGTAAWFALCDNSASLLQISGNLGASQAVTNGNPFSLTEMKVGLPDPS